MANVNTKGNQKTTMSWCNNKQNDIEMYHNNTIDDILTDDKQQPQQQPQHVPQELFPHSEAK